MKSFRPLLRHRFQNTSAVVAGVFLALGQISCSQFQEAAAPLPTTFPAATITVKVDDPGKSISPTFYGLMTEEINHSYDGGLYAELIQNRAFQNSQLDNQIGRGGGRRGRGGATNPASSPETAPAPQTPNYLIHWSVVNSNGATGTFSIDTNNPVNTTALKNSLKLDIANVGDDQRVGVANDGYWGIPVKPNTEYKASFYARSSAGMSSPLTVSIESNDGKTTYASGTVSSVGTAWHKYSLTLKTGQVKPTADTRFVISAAKPGTLWLSLVSLFPPTYNNRPNGSRVDIMQKLVDMKPGFLRFPGGNYLEGRGLAERWAWKTTIGPLEDRTGHGNSAWRYRASDGLGMLEFLEWCEDMHAEPVLALYSGFGLSGSYVARGDEIKPFVQEGLDAIEFATGDASTQWGAQRAKLGHPAPFKLTYVEIGNEENLGGGLATYPARFEAFYDAIRAKYPKIQIISSVAGVSRNSVLTRKPDVVDDHHYMTIPQALDLAHGYDNADRNGPKLFIGEWATRIPASGDTCNLAAGVADAAFLTGLERNADVIIMNCYAPLFVNVNPGGKQWNVDLIGYDALNSFGSPSYYVQSMFSNNRGDTVVPATVSGVDRLTSADLPQLAPGGRGGGAPPATQAAYDAVYATASKVDSNGDLILKLVNFQKAPQQVTIDLQGVARVQRNATVEVLTGNPDDINTVAEPTKIAPKKTTIDNVGRKFIHELPPYSVTVLRLKTR
ncbi:MAG TPA: alpha-L-arabinofuranosidase C-terminal domain-containing protein [Tepidisphaeraceae bacterium]|nr:alpha-L-arabinofuranosidase C-terminal domain-containing protein [Tepidisphaeraceae bacterium]